MVYSKSKAKTQHLSNFGLGLKVLETYVAYVAYVFAGNMKNNMPKFYRLLPREWRITQTGNMCTCYEKKTPVEANHKSPVEPSQTAGPR